MINALVCDLIETTEANIARARPETIADVRSCPQLVSFSEGLRESQREMKQFLRKNLYQHYQVLRMTAKAHRIVKDLFAAFLSDPRMLPPQYQDEADQARGVADYVAGMTDRYAMKEHRRLFAVGEI